MVGTYDGARKQYYYTNFRQHHRFPSDDRTAEKHLAHGLRCDNTLSDAERRRIQLETGVRGVSVLFKLHKLYGFDPIKDMVIDRMHLCFNMLKREFLENMWVDMGDNSARPVNDRDPADGGLLFRDELRDALAKVQWTREQKASGSASVSSLSDKLGGWKSDQFLK